MKEKKYAGVYLDKKNNTYYVSTTFVTKDGFHIKKCKRGFDTAKKADAWKHECALQIKKTNYGTGKTNKKNWGDLLNDYLNYKKNKVKSGTLIQTEPILKKYFLNFFEKIEPQKITPKDIMKFYDSLATTNNTPQYKNIILSHIKTFIDWLDLMELLDSTIVRKFKLICVRFTVTQKPKNDFLELDEFDKFIETFKDNSREEKLYKLLFRTLFYGGMRIGELRALKYKEIDFENNVITVSNQLRYIANKKLIKQDGEIIGKNILLSYTKTNSTKVIELPEWLIEYFEELKQIDNAQEDDFIFVINGKNINENLIRIKLNQHLQMAGIKKVKIHDFRHSNTTLLYDMGADESFVQQRLGHSNPNTSKKTYNHMTERRKEYNSLIIKQMKQV